LRQLGVDGCAKSAADWGLANNLVFTRPNLSRLAVNLLPRFYCVHEAHHNIKAHFDKHCEGSLLKSLTMNSTQQEHSKGHAKNEFRK